MTLETPHIIAALAIISSLLVFALGLYMNRKFKRQDDHEERIRSLELAHAGNYGSRDAVDAAVVRAMEPLRDSIDRQEGKVDELSSLVLKLIHAQGVR